VSVSTERAPSSQNDHDSVQIFPELLQQGFDLCVLELNDLLLPFIDHGAEGSEQDVPWLEQEGHVRRRKSASVQCRRMKSSGRDERLW
jgi:hypothetical protein